MSPLVTGMLLVTAGVAVWSCIARQRPARDFALYNLANACVCIVLDHSISAVDWVYAFAFMDAFAGCAAFLVAVGSRCKWLVALGLIYLAQCGLHVAFELEVIGEHTLYRPGINAMFWAGNAALCWGIARTPRRVRGYSV
jgi:hypothetical protein